MRSPQVRTHSFTAQPPDLHHLALITRASWFLAQSPCLAVPYIRFLSIGSQFMLHASFPHSVALMQLRLRFARRDQLATGLAPVGVRPCWADKEKPLWLNSGSFEWRRGPESNRPTRICNPVHNRFATAPILGKKREADASPFSKWSGRRVSNSRPQPWQGCALPTELLPRGYKL